MYSLENKSEESRAFQSNLEKQSPTAQFKDNRAQSPIGTRDNTVQREKKENRTGLPDDLKSGIESLSGFSMDDVRVHYNSSKPATVQALAYTQGTDIHVAPGQEKHLPHEAWHVAQQMAGRVSPTTNINGMPVNDNTELEHEADVMGAKAVQRRSCEKENTVIPCFHTAIQCYRLQSKNEKEASVVLGEISTLGDLNDKIKKVKEYEKEKNVCIENKIEDEKGNTLPFIRSFLHMKILKFKNRDNLKDFDIKSYKSVFDIAENLMKLLNPEIEDYRLITSWRRVSNGSNTSVNPNMRMIDSPSSNIFVHVSRSITEDEKIERPKNLVFDSFGRANAISLDSDLDKEKSQFVNGKNAHITLEGRYWRVLLDLANNITDNRDLIKYKTPVDGEYNNLNFKKNLSSDDTQQTEHSLLWWIQEGAKRARDILLKHPVDMFASGERSRAELIDAVDEVESHTLKCAKDLINGINDLKEDPNRLIHYGGTKWF